MARSLALVTGATAGIGAAFADQLAAAGYDLVLVARDAARLRECAERIGREHRVQATALPADLTDGHALESVAERLTDPAAPVDLLVNNAGLSLNRPFRRSTPAEQERLLRLNVHAVMRLTLAAVPAMVERGSGGVINVSSVAGFATLMPGSTYPASKAWVTAFTESVAGEVRPYGVRVTALCPGFVRTEFHDRAGIDMSKASDAWWLSADDVAADGLRAWERGRIVRVVDWRYRMLVGALRLVPRGLLQRIARDTRRRAGRGDR